MKFLFILLFAILSPVLSQQWIDPYDMNTSSKKNLKKSSSTGDEGDHENVESCQCNKETGQENNSLIYLQRFVSLLLNSANVDHGSPSVYHGKLHFVLDDTSFQFLKDFSENKHASSDQLRKLDVIVSDIFQKPYLEGYPEMFISLQERVVTFLFSKNSLPIVGLSVFIYIAYNLFRSNFSVWYVLRYFIFIIILLDFVQRYQQLYEEAEEHNMKVEYTAKCDTDKMSWTEWLKFMTRHEDCEKKSVSLLEVGLLQVKSLIIVPLSAAGTGLGHFGAELWRNLPFPWNILIFPLMLIFSILLAVIVMTTINGTPFRVNLMHLFHFELGEKKNHVAGVTLERLLDAVSRPMIEEVKGRKKEAVQGKKKEQSQQKQKTTRETTDKKVNSPRKKDDKKIDNGSGDNFNKPVNKKTVRKSGDSSENNSETSSGRDNEILNSIENNCGGNPT